MKFKVGDRVEYIGNDQLDPLSYGDKGRVILCCDYMMYYVEWDKRDSRMHDGNGNGKDHHCWFVRECEIRKVKEEKKMTSNEVTNALMNVLGVEVEEKFNVPTSTSSPFHFRKDGRLIDCNGSIREDIFGGIAMGTRKINKISIKEMTVSEIEKELGYKIKVVVDKEETK